MESVNELLLQKSLTEGISDFMVYSAGPDLVEQSLERLVDSPSIEIVYN